MENTHETTEQIARRDMIENEMENIQDVGLLKGGSLIYNPGGWPGTGDYCLYSWFSTDFGWSDHYQPVGYTFYDAGIFPVLYLYRDLFGYKQINTKTR